MDKQLEAGDLDLLVLRQLSALPAFEPRRGFGDRVMAGVAMPRPKALVLFRRAGAWVAQPARAAALAASYLVAVGVTLRLAIPWLQAHSSAFAFVGSWLVGRVGAVADSVTVTLGSWAVQTGAARAFQSAASAGPRLWAGLGALTIAYAVCVYGLRALLKTPGRKDVALAGTL